MSGRIIGVVFLVLVALGIWYLIKLGPTTESVVMEDYANPVYGYSFSYPDQYALNEYAPEFVSVGMPVEGGFASDVDVTVVASEPGATYASFDEFVMERIRAVCAADGPTISYRCTDLDDQETFIVQGGKDGTEYSLDLVKADLAAGTTDQSSFGPVIAFELDAPEEGGYRALLVYEPLASFLEGTDRDLVRTIAGSVDF